MHTTTPRVFIKIDASSTYRNPDTSDVYKAGNKQ